MVLILLIKVIISAVSKESLGNFQELPLDVVKFEIIVERWCFQQRRIQYKYKCARVVG